jgi:hypothetical protein
MLEPRNEARARELVIEQHIESLLRTYLDRELERSWPDQARCDRLLLEFRRFESWVHARGIDALPCSAHVAASYLLDLMLEGVSLGDIVTAADAIVVAHDTAGKFLDLVPVFAALNLVEERTRTETVTGTRH